MTTTFLLVRRKSCQRPAAISSGTAKSHQHFLMLDMGIAEQAEYPLAPNAYATVPRLPCFRLNTCWPASAFPPPCRQQLQPDAPRRMFTTLGTSCRLELPLQCGIHGSEQRDGQRSSSPRWACTQDTNLYNVLQMARTELDARDKLPMHCKCCPTCLRSRSIDRNDCFEDCKNGRPDPIVVFS